MPKIPSKPFPEFLRDKAKHYLKISRRGDNARSLIATTLTRRLRAQSLSDIFGCFSPNAGSLSWIGDAPGSMSFANMKSLNIVQPIVQMISVAMVSAHVKLVIEAANKDPELGGAANVTRALFVYWVRRKGYWEGIGKNRIASMQCLHYGYFIRSHSKSEKSQHEEQGFNLTDFPEPGMFVCAQCGAEGPFFGEARQEGEFSVTDCPQCGKTAEVTQEPSESEIEVPGGMQKAESKGNCTSVISPFYVRLDERNSQNGNMSEVDWLDYHPLYTQEEMQSEFGEFDYGNPTEWSYPARWGHALETGTIAVEKSRTSTEDEVKMWEVRHIWMRPNEYLTYTPPSEHEIKDANDEVIDVIEPDTPLIEQKPEGFCFKITGEKLLPYFQESDLQNEWDYGGLRPDPFSFWHTPLVPVIQIQDDVNTMYTIDMQHRERNAQVGIIFKDEAFDADSFENDLIPAKNGYQMDGPIGEYVQTFQTPPMTEAKSGLQMLLAEVIPNFLGFQPAAVGAPAPSEPYAAQLLQKQQSLGQLTQAQQSQANCEVSWFKKQAKMAQSWPPAKLQYIRTRLGEEWKEEDIEAFYRCDIENDLDIDYLVGSEVPTSLVEREVKINNLMTQISQINPEVFAQIPKEIVSQWLETTGIDFDVENTEGQDRLENRRYEAIKEGVQNGQNTEAIFALPIMHVLPDEKQDTAIEFWVDRQIAQMCEQEPDTPTLVAAYGRMIQLHKQSAESQQPPNPEAEAQAAELAAAQQTKEQEAQLRAAELEAQKESDAQRAQSENLRTFADAADADASREHELNKIALEQAHDKTVQTREHQHNKELEEKRLAVQKETANTKGARA